MNPLEIKIEQVEADGIKAFEWSVGDKGGMAATYADAMNDARIATGGTRNISPPGWKIIGLWRLCVCLERGALRWANDPMTGRCVLKSRVGKTYDFKHMAAGYLLRRRMDLTHLIA